MTPVRSASDLPAVFAPVLERLREQAPALIGKPVVRIIPVAYQARPFSNVMRLGIAADDGPPTSYWFAKVHVPKDLPDAIANMSRRVRREFDTTLKVETALAAYPGMEALHPVVCYPELLAIVTEEICGVTLLQYLERRVSWLSSGSSLAEAEDAARRTGVWLRAFQAIEPSNDHVDGAELRDYVDLRLRRLVSSGKSPITEPVRRRILGYIDSLLPLVAPHAWRSVLRHADLAPGNVMVTPRGVAVLDFAMTSRGTYLHDLTRLSLQIDLMSAKPQFRRRAVTRVRAALLRGFDASVTESHPLFRLLTLLHRVNHVATLTLKPGRGAIRLYQSRLVKMHERAIAAELDDRADAISQPGTDSRPGR